MKKAGYLLYLLMIVYMCHLTFFLATDYQDNQTRRNIPFVIWTIDTIDLFIHETGHFVFGIFGRFIGFLGGSIFQVLIPAVTLVVFGRSNLRSLPFTLYWTGQSLINVSIYIGDAPYQKLQLISRAAIHDWKWLLTRTNTMENAADIASAVNLTGLIVCSAGIIIGLYFSYKGLIPLFQNRIQVDRT